MHAAHCKPPEGERTRNCRS